MNFENFSVCFGSENLREAAEIFVSYLNSAGHASVHITDDFSQTPKISLITDSEETRNGYVISSECGDIFIKGSDLAQLVRGMYAFLVKYVGIRYYTSLGPSFTKEGSCIPVDERYVYTPFFDLTDTDWLSPKDVQYSLFNGLNGSEYRKIPSSLGGSDVYISGFAHTLVNQFCSAKKYYKDHPGYFAVHRGRQTDAQLCLSNPEVYRIVRDEVFELLAEKHDPDAPLQIISLTQHDNFKYCTCAKCRETDRKYRSHAGTMLEFVNGIAREVAAAGYDNVMIDTFAYRYTRTPPVGIVPEKNVIVRLCSIECCFSHPFDSPSCKTNKAFMDDLRGWSRICDNIHIWDYCTNFANYVGIFPDFGVLQRDMQIFAENNVKGIYEEGNYGMRAECEFGELRAWLISQLFLDPYLDYDAAVAEFCDSYYGKSGSFVKSFIHYITEKQSSRHLGIYQSMRATLGLSRTDISACDAFWKNAVEASSHDETSLDHVNRSMLSWRWYKMGNRKAEFGDIFSFRKNKEQLLKELSDSGIRDLREMGHPLDTFIMLYQDLYFGIYPILNAVLRFLYRT